MKILKLIALLSISLLGALPSIASARDFVSVHLGTTTDNLTLKRQNLDSFGVTVGRTNVLPNVNAQLTYNSLDTLGNVSGNEVLLNGTYQPIKAYGFTPYVGAGLGYGDYNHTRQSRGLLTNVLYGVTYDLNDKWGVDLGGKYTYAPNLYVTKNNKLEYNTVNLAVRYNFH